MFLTRTFFLAAFVVLVSLAIDALETNIRMTCATRSGTQETAFSSLSARENRTQLLFCVVFN